LDFRRILLGNIGMTPNELWSIGSERKFDTDDFVVGHCMVILFQSSANIARLNTHYGVVASGIACRTLKEVRTDDALFERFVIPVQLVLHDIREELLSASGRPEKGAVQDRFQFLDDSFLFGKDFRAILTTNLMVPDRIDH
jgi:hypothetical protein